MKVVLAGINQDTLDAAEQKIKATGATTLTVRVAFDFGRSSPDIHHDLRTRLGSQTDPGTGDGV